MKLILTILVLFLPVYGYSTEGTGKTLLCITEKASQVINEGSGKYSAEAGQFSEKYIVTPDKGVRKFGSEEEWLSDCEYDSEDVPRWCEYPGQYWSGLFKREPDNTFVLSGMSGFKSNEKMAYFWMIGKCSSL